MPSAYARIAFTPGVRAEQARFGSAEGQGCTGFGPREATLLCARDSICVASVSETGWPHVQHRGGAPGFVRITEDPQIVTLLYGAECIVAERGMNVQVAAVDWNCPQHIPLRRPDPERDVEVSRLREEIACLERELDAKAALHPGAGI